MAVKRSESIIPCIGDGRVTEYTHETPRRQSKQRQRLRRLAEEANNKCVRQNITKTLRWRLLTILFIVCCILVTQHYYDPAAHFFQTYNKNYQQILHGRLDYCDQLLNSEALTMEIAKNHGILNQDESMRQLELAMRNEGRAFKPIVVVGSSGVGKSMWARALEQHFPWSENVYAYAWNAHVKNEAQKLFDVNSFINKFSTCGENLLVIDNLPARQYRLVEIINEMIISVVGESIRVLVVYIFNMNTMEKEVLYRQQYETLQSLPDTKTVNFKSLGVNEIKDCVLHATVAENITLNERNFNEIMESLVALNSGCKMVHKKLLLYKRAEKSND